MQQPERGGPSAHAAAVTLLARRDYATAELRAALRARGFADEAQEETIAVLTREGALDDARFADNYVSHQAARGHGPVRIAAALRQRGVADPLIDAALGRESDWAARALKARRAKFGARTPETWAEKAKQARFLQYRGFSSDHIRSATGADPEMD
ncbi:MAG TPA: regulatory protein RecX [Steroidobacteraceae bacterium]|nr:regulatory protein RecX [Steroidobacteraceae bacterium]